MARGRRRRHPLPCRLLTINCATEAALAAVGADVPAHIVVDRAGQRLGLVHEAGRQPVTEFVSLTSQRARQQSLSKTLQLPGTAHTSTLR